MTIEETQREIIKEFEEFQNWEEKYTYIIQIGRELSGYPEDYRKDDFKISGCQSQVWIHAQLDKNNVLFVADSDAMIVKGLIALLLRVYSGHTPDEILSTPPDFIQKIGIDNHLSPTRKNGLGSMLKQIKMYAIAFKAITDKTSVNQSQN